MSMDELAKVRRELAAKYVLQAIDRPPHASAAGARTGGGASRLARPPSHVKTINLITDDEDELSKDAGRDGDFGDDDNGNGPLLKRARMPSKGRRPLSASSMAAELAKVDAIVRTTR